jgi:2',3'-cyclic-nucleotide 2'-phosphodiesterase (5'-nucleotidase family)
MRRSFSYALLITLVFVFYSCSTHFNLTQYETKNLPVNQNVNKLDSQLVLHYIPFKQQLEQDMQRVISVSENELVKDKPESYLTNFLADLLIEEGEIEFQKTGKVEALSVSYFNYGGIRTFLPKGEITVGKIFELMPFENEMVFLKLSGVQVHEFLNHIAEKGGDSVGGCRFVIANKKAKDIKINGEPLKNSKFYWLVTNDYVANGGDGLEVFTYRDEIINTGIKIRDVIISHLEKQQEKGVKITAKLDGRITYE